MSAASSLWLPSASSAARSSRCPASVVLPKSRGTAATPEMLRGSYLHLLLEAKFSEVTDLNLRLDDLAKQLGDEVAVETFASVSRITSDEILRGAEFIAAEPAFAYNPTTDTARLLGTSIERSYLQHGWKPTEEIAGTADVILRTPRGTLLVGDYKTGHLDNQVSYGWRPQLLWLALMAARHYREDRVSVGICLVFDEGRVRWVQQELLDVFDLESIAEDLRAAQARWLTAAIAQAEERAPEAHAGPWCDYCACKPVCPAWGLLARQMASGACADTVIADLTREQAGTLWEELKIYQAILDYTKEQLEAKAARGPLPLSGNRVLRRQTCEREALNSREVAGYIARTYSPDVAAQIADVKITKTAMERVLGPEESEKTLAACRAAGYVSTTSYTVCKPVAVKVEP